jgi:hypothetical protein
MIKMYLEVKLKGKRNAVERSREIFPKMFGPCPMSPIKGNDRDDGVHCFLTIYLDFLHPVIKQFLEAEEAQ